jgi:hypothetical protein
MRTNTTTTRSNRLRRACATAALAILCAMAAGCGGGAADAQGSGRPTVAIASVSVDPTTVADGATFEVTWDVSHSNHLGEFIEMGLYLGTAADLTSASALDARVFFDQATTPGSGLPDPSHSHITCTRTGTGVLCGDGAGMGIRAVPTGGLTETTFRACNSLVTDSSSEVCDTRALELTFP